MESHDTDFSLSLEELTGLNEGDPEDAPTPMVAAIIAELVAEASAALEGRG